MCAKMAVEHQSSSSEWVSVKLNSWMKFSVLKKVKHRVVETMNSGTADALGLSRAILCNGECFVKKDILELYDFCETFM